MYTYHREWHMAMLGHAGRMMASAEWPQCATQINGTGRTLLHVAGSAAVALDARNNVGRTALNVHAEWARRGDECWSAATRVKCLLDAGADVCAGALPREVTRHPVVELSFRAAHRWMHKRPLLWLLVACARQPLDAPCAG